MNKHQKIAFGATALLAFAFMVAWTTRLEGLGFVLVLAFVVALLTLPVTWKLLIGIVLAVGHVLSLTGDALGYIGRWVITRSETAIAALSSPKAVPSWDELSTERSDELTLDTMFH